ncbi:hypothetical protein SAMN02910327_01403 [Peptostreptococcaceae bacterium pGA-8]|nr:hypothetical protein SAMN02910327_01403 [Peptostreptococcaceae bacterium pGA-8]
MSKRLLIPTIISTILVIYCTVLIALYLLALHEEITFVQFLLLLLVPVAIGVTAICKLLQKSRT